MQRRGLDDHRRGDGSGRRALHLTPHAAIGTLLARFGLRARAVRLVARLDCEIYRISCPGGADLALRIYPAGKSDRAPIEAEIAWLAALAADGLLAPRPLADRSGRTLQSWQPDPTKPARHAVLLTWVHGRMLDAGLRPLHLRRVGELTARMHLAAQRLVREGRIGTSRPADGPDLAGWASGARERPAHLSTTAHARVCATARALLEEFAALPRDAGSWGFVHSDLHLWNLLFAGSAAGAIDFSECGFGRHALDLAATLQYLRHPFVHNRDHRAQYDAMRAALFEGYARHRPLPAQAERQVDACIVARMINTVEWVVDSWPRVHLRPWGPGFLRRSQAVFEAFLR